jgi:hypothetical protein
MEATGGGSVCPTSLFSASICASTLSTLGGAEDSLHTSSLGTALLGLLLPFSPLAFVTVTGFVVVTDVTGFETSGCNSFSLGSFAAGLSTKSKHVHRPLLRGIVVSTFTILNLVLKS